MTDAVTNTQSPTIGLPHLRTRRVKRLLLLVVIPAVAVLVGATLYLRGGRYVETENAYIKADKIPVSAEVSGTITQVLVRENQAVSAGISRCSASTRRRSGSRSAKPKPGSRRSAPIFLHSKRSYREKQAEIALAHTKYAFTRRTISCGRPNWWRKTFHLRVPASIRRETGVRPCRATDHRALEQDLIRIAETLGGSLDTPVEIVIQVLSRRAGRTRTGQARSRARRGKGLVARHREQTAQAGAVRRGRKFHGDGLGGQWPSLDRGQFH